MLRSFRRISNHNYSTKNNTLLSFSDSWSDIDALIYTKLKYYSRRQENSFFGQVIVRSVTNSVITHDIRSKSVYILWLHIDELYFVSRTYM